MASVVALVRPDCEAYWPHSSLEDKSAYVVNQAKIRLHMLRGVGRGIAPRILGISLVGDGVVGP